MLQSSGVCSGWKYGTWPGGQLELLNFDRTSTMGEYKLQDRKRTFKVCARHLLFRVGGAGMNHEHLSSPLAQ